MFGFGRTKKPVPVKVPSKHSSFEIETVGFEITDDIPGLFPWPADGADLRREVTRDAENQIYKQDPGAQILSITCIARPEMEASVGEYDATGTRRLLRAFKIVFPLTVRLRAGAGKIHILDIKQHYSGAHLDQPDRSEFGMDFIVIQDRVAK